MEWRKPHYKKGGQQLETINPVARQLFDPSSSEPAQQPSLSALVNAMMPSCPKACVWDYVRMPDTPKEQYPPYADFNVASTVTTVTMDVVPPTIQQLIAQVHDLNIKIILLNGVFPNCWSDHQMTRHIWC